MGFFKNLFSSLMGTNTGAAGQQMSSDLANQGLAAGQMNTGINNLTSTAGTLNSPLASTTSMLQGGLTAATPGYTSGMGTALSSGGNLSNQTGVNQNAVGQQAINYETNTGGTNLASATPGLNTFYQGEMNNGLNQQTQLNAQSQLQQQFGQSEAAIKNNAAPGTNTANQQQQAQNQLISGSTNLAGSLAGQNQQVMQQGAQGVASTAGSLDTQTMNMLTQALSGSQGLNSTTLQNLISVLGLGTGAISQGLTSSSQGTAAQQDANSTAGSLFTGYTGQLTGDATAASNTASANQKSAGGLVSDVAGLFGL
jgi:hypothetical protein